MNRAAGPLAKVLAWSGVLMATTLGALAMLENRRSSDRPEASMPSTPRACESLLPRDVKRLMNFPPDISVRGTPVYAVAHINVPGMAECIWSPQKATGFLVVGAAIGLDREVFSKWERAAAESGRMRRLEGLGKEAVWIGNAADRQEGTLVLREEGIVIGVKTHVVGDTQATSFERAKVIAGKVLEGLRSQGATQE